MRKKGRERNAAWAREVIERAPFVTMSMVRPDGTPYGIPISIVVASDISYYFHCAFDGEKIDCLRGNPVVSLSAVSKCSPAYEEDKQNYTMHYRSAVALGRAVEVTDRAEKISALRLLCERFLPRYMEDFDAAIARSLDRTDVWRIDLLEPPVGKEKGVAKPEMHS